MRVLKLTPAGATTPELRLIADKIVGYARNPEGGSRIIAGAEGSVVRETPEKIDAMLAAPDVLDAAIMCADLLRAVAGDLPEAWKKTAVRYLSALSEAQLAHDRPK